MTMEKIYFTLERDGNEPSEDEGGGGGGGGGVIFQYKDYVFMCGNFHWNTVMRLS